MKWTEFHVAYAVEAAAQRQGIPIISASLLPPRSPRETNGMKTVTIDPTFSSIHPTSTQLILTKAQFAPWLIIFEYHNRVEVEKEAADLDIINFD